jgi:predicted signal transduction protein with EAL and GGDEF domain
MGHAVQSTDAMTGEELVRRADLAMYESKRRQNPAAVAFGEVVDKAGHDARTVERALREALQRPASSGSPTSPSSRPGAPAPAGEALARWTSPELGSVPPTASSRWPSRAGLIGELGRRILHLVCDDLAAHPSCG